MLGWLYRTIIGRFSLCEHKWKTIDDRVLISDLGGRGHRYHVECEKCGWIKKIDLI